ncbi:MAG: FAD-dependent oxidoreductase [Lysobacteraceae bacterium]
MSRSPLFHSLRRAAVVAIRAQRLGMPVEELRQQAQELRIDRARRRFLGQAGAGAAVLGLAACQRAVPSMPKDGGEPVVIVGAGVAGLTAAWRLRQAGVAVQVIEANNRIGGRMFSLRGHFPDEQVVELGGELIDTDHVRIRALAEELGIVLDDLLASAGDFEGDIWFANGRHYGEADLVREFAPLALAIERDLAALGNGDILWNDPQGATALDALSITQWLDREGADGWLRRLIEVAYTTEMGLECDEQSALNLLTFIGTEPDRFDIFGGSDERFHVRGGNDRIIHALGEHLSDAIETGSALEALAQDTDGRYRLSLRRGNASVQRRARQVLLAIPFTTLRQVRLDVALPEHKRRAIERLRYGSNAKLMIGFNERIWNTRYRQNGSAFADLPFQTTWDTSRAQAGTGGILTNFTGGRHGIDIGEGSAKQQADAAVTQLDALYPGILAAREGAREVRMHWPTQPWAQGSYACFTPGDWTAIRGAMGEKVGQLYFAGEHCALDTQGFMEGGCESGETVATEILSDRKAKVASLRHRLQTAG